MSIFQPAPLQTLIATIECIAVAGLRRKFCGGMLNNESRKFKIPIWGSYSHSQIMLAATMGVTTGR